MEEMGSDLEWRKWGQTLIIEEMGSDLDYGIHLNFV